MRYTYPPLPLLLGLLLTDGGLAAAEHAKLSLADGSPLDPGVVELGAAIAVGRADRSLDVEGAVSDRGGNCRTTDLAVCATRGMCPDVDAGIAIGWSRVRDTAGEPDTGQGFADAVIAVKWRVLSAASTDVAVIPAVTVPLARHPSEDRLPTSSADTAYGLTAASCTDVGPFEIGTAWGAQRNTGDSFADSRGSVNAGAAFGWQVTPTLQPSLELLWQRDLAVEADDPWSATLTGGVIISLECSRWTVAVGQVVDGAQADRGTTLTVSGTWIIAP